MIQMPMGDGNPVNTKALFLQIFQKRTISIAGIYNHPFAGCFIQHQVGIRLIRAYRNRLNFHVPL